MLACEGLAGCRHREASLGRKHLVGPGSLCGVCNRGDVSELLAQVYEQLAVVRVVRASWVGAVAPGIVAEPHRRVLVAVPCHVEVQHCDEAQQARQSTPLRAHVNAAQMELWQTGWVGVGAPALNLRGTEKYVQLASWDIMKAHAFSKLTLPVLHL